MDRGEEGEQDGDNDDTEMEGMQNKMGLTVCRLGHVSGVNHQLQQRRTTWQDEKRTGRK
jgi:hypothetical protein